MSRAELVTCLQRGEAIFLAGSGVSVAATDGAAGADWVGLVLAGREKVQALELSSPGWEKSVEATIGAAVDDNDSSMLITAAEMITTKLGGRGSLRFREWLADTVGGLRLRSTELIAAIDKFSMPIATTNYDSLIEQTTSRPAVTWTDQPGMQMALTRRTRNVMHLHGIWDAPESVIFGSESYGQIANSETVQATQRALIMTHSLVFVGVGGGVADPNVGALLAWLQDTLPETAFPHYLLCRSEEAGQLSVQFSKSPVKVVVYGDSHEDLPRFLSELYDDVPTSGPVARENALRAMDYLAERIAEDAIILRGSPGPTEWSLEDFLIPPVLLPLPPEQFAEMRANGEGPKPPERCDPESEAVDPGLLLLVGDANSGLTSAARWLASRRYASDPAICPVVVDYGHLTSGSRPLDRLVRSTLLQAEVAISKKSALPTFTLAVDNVVPARKGVSKRFDRFIEEVVSLSGIFKVILTCPSGGEAELATRLIEEGCDSVVTRYLGRFNTRDARALARLYTPADPVALSERAIDFIRREHLPRTPTTLALLFAVLLEVEAIVSAASETVLLDRYVSLLLGRDDPTDDSRWDLDAVEREALLAAIAAVFVRLRKGSISEATIVQEIERRFEALGWRESATDLLSSLIGRRILVKSAGYVRFARSSFLHLFAAKGMLRDTVLRAEILEKPLYFSEIVRHYAALSRRDEELLAIAKDLVSVEQVAPHSSAWFVEVAPTDLSSQTDASDPLKEIDAARNSRRPSAPAADDDALDAVTDHDSEPFPVVDVTDATPALRLASALVLGSNVLRDSELVENVALKRDVLVELLVGWGRLVDLLEADEAFQEMMEKIVAGILEEMSVDEADRPEMQRALVEVVAFFASLGLMAENLATRKLVGALSGAFEIDDLVRDPAGAVMGALFALQVDQDWVERFGIVQERHGRVRAVTLILRRLALVSYLDENAGTTQRSRIEDFLVEQYASDWTGPSDQIANMKSQARSRLSRRRLIELGRNVEIRRNSDSLDVAI